MNDDSLRIVDADHASDHERAIIMSAQIAGARMFHPPRASQVEIRARRIGHRTGMTKQPTKIAILSGRKKATSGVATSRAFAGRWKREQTRREAERKAEDCLAGDDPSSSIPRCAEKQLNCPRAQSSSVLMV